MDREETIFEHALEIGSPPAREAYLRSACTGDASMLDRLQGLLGAHDRARGFLEHGPHTDMTPDADFGGVLLTASAAMPPSLTEKAGDRIGRYRLLQQIGEGGCGVVYMAEQEQPVRRRVALKIIKLGMDTRRVVARFEAERQALALMDHPNIARIHDGGATATGRPYFVMELVRGVKITEHCDQKTLSTQARLELFIQVCRAVQHAHQKGIIHRDLKPSNILVTVNDGMAVPKIIDFGIAKAVNDQRLTDKTLFTAFEQFIGTPAYMSPEQAQVTSVDIDTRSDIYSLGVLLYELLTGRTPFDTAALLKGGLDQMRWTIREQEPARPSARLRTLSGDELTATASHRCLEPPKLISQLRGDLDWIVMKCLEKERARRYETAGGLARDVEHYLHHEPVVARPPSRIYEFKKTVRRHWMGFTATAAVVAALAFGLVASTLEAVHARRAEREQIRLTRAAQTAQQKEAEQRQRAQAGEAYAQGLLYAANMNLAQQAWDRTSLGRVRQLLEDTSSYPDRGFEWYYWQRQTHLELQTLSGHLGGIRAVAFSPDGRQILTGSEDQTAMLWDAATGKELFPLSGHRRPVVAAAFSTDGHRLVTADVRATRVWDTASGKLLFTIKGNSALTVSAAFSPDGRRIVTGSHNGVAEVRDVASGSVLLTLRGHTGRINWAGFLPDGQRIVTASGDGTARIWDSSNGNALLTLHGHRAGILAVAVAPDSQWIVTGSDDQTAGIWETSSGKQLFSLPGHQAAIVAVAVCPDGQRIVTGSADHTAKVWEAASGRLLFNLEGHHAPIAALAVSPDGRHIVTGSEDQTARIWETVSGKPLSALKGHSAPVVSVAFSPDGRRIITGSADHTAKLWAMPDDEQLTLKGHSGAILAVDFSPDGRRIATASADGTAKVWEAAHARELVPLVGHSSPVRCVAFSPNGRCLVTASGDETARVWDAASGRELCSLRGQGGAIISAAFSPDGQRIVTGGDDQTVRVWDAARGTLLLVLSGHRDAIFAVAFSPDGRHLATGSRDRTAKVWDAASGQLTFTLTGHAGTVSSIAFSPDGKRIVTGSWDKTAKVWDASNAKELFALRGHSDQISAVAFVPDGRRILTGSRDRTARLWEAASGKELLTLHGHTAYISSVAFSPDGQRIITGSGDQTAKVWQAAATDQFAAWHREESASAERLANLARQRAAGAESERTFRAHDPGAIKLWLVLAPMRYQGRNGAIALSQEQVPHEALLLGRAGEGIQVDGAERVWRVVSSDDYLLDFNRILNANTRSSVAYAVCYVESETVQSGLSMKIGSDDQSKVYLNGNEVYRCEFDRTYIPDEDVVTGVELKAGPNVLVFKVVNEAGEWQGSVRFTDSADKPVKGIRVALTPPRVGQPLGPAPPP